MAFPDPAISSADGAPDIAWHADSAEAAARRLSVDSAIGLTGDDAAARLAKHGPNRLTEMPGKPAWRRFAAQLTEPLVLVLIAAGVITVALGETVDASVIFGVVIVNAIIGYWQEAKAEGALAALARVEFDSGTMSEKAWERYQGVSPESLALFAENFNIEIGEAFQQYYRVAASTRSTSR